MINIIISTVKRKLLLLSVILFALLAVLVVQKIQLNKDPIMEIPQFIQMVQNEKHKQLIGKKNNLEDYYIDEGKGVINKINNYRANLSKIKFYYTDYNSNITIDSIQQTQEGIVVYFTERLELTTNDPDPDNPNTFIISKGYYKYRFVLNKSGKRFFVKSDEAFGDDLYYINTRYLPTK